MRRRGMRRGACRRRCRWSTCCRPCSNSPVVRRRMPWRRWPASRCCRCVPGSEQARTVVGEYAAEGACAPIVMLRRGTLKFVHCAVDPDQLYDLATDPHERVNLAADPAWAATVTAFRAEVAATLGPAALPRRGAAGPGAAAVRGPVAAARTAHAVGLHAAARCVRRVHAQPPGPQRGRAQGALAALIPALRGFSPPVARRR